jgi:HSP20 family molecular chaperone IbpA
MNHELNLKESENKSRKTIIFSGPRTVLLLEQARTLWNHLLHDARAILRNQPASHVHPRVDVLENNSLYDIRVDLPGVDANSIELTNSGRLLRLKAKRKMSESADLRVSHCEHKTETYERDIRLSEDALIDEKSATFSEGILSIRVPKKVA